MSKNQKIDMKKENQYVDEIIHIPNPEKKFHESWYKGRNKLNFPSPFRIFLASNQPNMGKTNIIKNIIIRANPKFKKIYLFHIGGKYSKEYDDIDFELLDEIPEPDDDIFDPKIKKLLIIEDKNFKFMTKQDLFRLDRAYGFTSTHRNLNICCACQSFFSCPTSVREMSNVYILWKTRDLDSLKTIGRRVGLKKEEIYELMKQHLKEPRDSLWIDNTFNTPYKLRKNGFEIIKFDEK